MHIFGERFNTVLQDMFHSLIYWDQVGCQFTPHRPTWASSSGQQQSQDTELEGPWVPSLLHSTQALPFQLTSCSQTEAGVWLIQQDRNGSCQESWIREKGGEISKCGELQFPHLTLPFSSQKSSLLSRKAPEPYPHSSDNMQLLLKHLSLAALKVHCKAGLQSLPWNRWNLWSRIIESLPLTEVN